MQPKPLPWMLPDMVFDNPCQLQGSLINIGVTVLCFRDSDYRMNNNFVLTGFDLMNKGRNNRHAAQPGDRGRSGRC